MYGKKNNHYDTIVGAGSHMKGEINCKGPSKISGHFEGELKGDDKIFVGLDAVIDGNIHAKEIEVDGTVKGTITSSERITLNESANVEGDLSAPSIIIEEGARFNGTSQMEKQSIETSNILTLENPKIDESAKAAP